MLVLRSSPASPFGRKVKIAAHLIGMIDQIRIEPTDTTDQSDTIRHQNPLGKIPTLILADESTIFDSRVILEYLDLLSGPGSLIPTAPIERIAALKLQALADGIADAALLQVYEVRLREENMRSKTWLDNQASKVSRGLENLELNPPSADGALTVGEIAVACALGYLDLRFQGVWRATHSRLVDFLNAFSKRVPAFDITRAAS